jgi:acyl-coenzyme A thioesterase PaaI-like protein
VTLFDEATAVAPAADGIWNVELRDEMSIVNGHPNGGYLLAVLGRAGVAAVDQPDRHVIAATSSYVTPPTTGPATVETEVLRRGRTASQVRARLVQDGRACVESLLTVGSLGGAPPDWGDALPPHLPDEATSRASTRERPPPPGALQPPLTKVVAMTFDPATFGFASGRPSGAGELRAWLRFVDDRPVDPLALLFAVDALPPATFEVAMTGWVPTLSLTAYVRAVPADGPLRLRFRVGQIAGGLADETCEVWDASGRLVAQSTQLAAIRLS